MKDWQEQFYEKHEGVEDDGTYKQMSTSEIKAFISQVEADAYDRGIDESGGDILMMKNQDNRLAGVYEKGIEDGLEAADICERHAIEDKNEAYERAAKVAEEADIEYDGHDRGIGSSRHKIARSIRELKDK
ncbi:MAG TPA: hypothetical protein ENI05_13325 [Porticoccus sp.]|nr:hypothetical protein [Porticoccus sp.]